MGSIQWDTVCLVPSHFWAHSKCLLCGISHAYSSCLSACPVRGQPTSFMRLALRGLIGRHWESSWCSLDVVEGLVWEKEDILLTCEKARSPGEPLALWFPT